MNIVLLLTGVALLAYAVHKGIEAIRESDRLIIETMEERP